MNEPNTPPTPLHTQKPRFSDIASYWSDKLGGPILTLCSLGLIIGLAITGIGLMGIAAITWLLSSADWFSGIALLTGGMFLASATALCLGQMSRAGDTLYRNLAQKRKFKTT